MKRIYLLVYLLIILFTFPCFLYAGSGYSLKCSNCGLGGKFCLGSGKITEVIANGYCLTCNKFVGLRKPSEGCKYIDDDGKEHFCTERMTEKEMKALEPVSYVYCPLQKTKRTLYSCPTCGKPFIQIIEEDFGTIENPEKIYCPKCGKKTLEGHFGIEWD